MHVMQKASRIFLFAFLNFIKLKKKYKVHFFATNAANMPSREVKNV